jgi:hypothetical protein
MYLCVGGESKREQEREREISDTGIDAKDRDKILSEHGTFILHNPLGNRPVLCQRAWLEEKNKTFWVLELMNHKSNAILNLQFPINFRLTGFEVLSFEIFMTVAVKADLMGLVGGCRRSRSTCYLCSLG